MSTAAITSCHITTAALRGVEAIPVQVEVVVSSGMPGFTIVGMGDASIQESRERIRAALRACGYAMPAHKVVVNLAPGSLRKTGTGYDLPIAVGILCATGQVNPQSFKNLLLAGELSLEGEVRPVAGLLAYALCARQLGFDIACAPVDLPMRIDGLNQYVISSLGHLRKPPFSLYARKTVRPDPFKLDFSDIAGHDIAKRALQIAAAGNHGVLMTGPPGSGKTMLASRMPSILPPLTEQELLEAAIIHSVAGEDTQRLSAGIRPCRMPHHTATMAGLVGGGSPPRPGEISLAHKGVLFLDELAEFAPSVLQGIRQPLESGRVTLTRADGVIDFPCEFLLLAATNPCPCGYSGDPERRCVCTEAQVRRYHGRIGGPLLDRIDLHITVSRLAASEVLSSGGGTSSSELLEGVMRARSFAQWRKEVKGDGDEKRAKTMISSCRLNAQEQEFFETSVKKSHLSGRSIIRTLALARTIADTEEELSVGRPHLCEALMFRLREGEAS